MADGVCKPGESQVPHPGGHFRQAIERTVRLVTTARLRDSVLRDLVDESELEALSEIEGAAVHRASPQSNRKRITVPPGAITGTGRAAAPF